MNKNLTEQIKIDTTRSETTTHGLSGLTTANSKTHNNSQEKNSANSQSNSNSSKEKDS